MFRCHLEPYSLYIMHLAVSCGTLCIGHIILHYLHHVIRFVNK